MACKRASLEIEEGLIVLHIVMHLCFVLDIISAIIIDMKLKSKIIKITE